MSSVMGCGSVCWARRASRIARTPVDGSKRMTSWFGGGSCRLGKKPSLGACLNTRRTSVSRHGRCLPVRMKNGTPYQRQLSIRSFSAA